MQKLRLIGKSGDDCLAEWDRELIETIPPARQAFQTNLTTGRFAFGLDGRGGSWPIKEFDESIPEILIVPPIQGG